MHFGDIADGRFPDVLEADNIIEVGIAKGAKRKFGREGVHEAIPP